MTDLKRLYAAIEGRTKGDWEADTFHSANEVNISEKGTNVWIDSIHVISFGDMRFIATMGTCADQIAAVLRAAEALIEREGFQSDPQSLDHQLAVALAALAAAVEGGA